MNEYITRKAELYGRAESTLSRAQEHYQPRTSRGTSRGASSTSERPRFEAIQEEADSEVLNPDGAPFLVGKELKIQGKPKMPGARPAGPDGRIGTTDDGKKKIGTTGHGTDPRTMKDQLHGRLPPSSYFLSSYKGGFSCKMQDSR